MDHCPFTATRQRKTSLGLVALALAIATFAVATTFLPRDGAASMTWTAPNWQQAHANQPPVPAPAVFSCTGGRA